MAQENTDMAFAAFRDVRKQKPLGQQVFDTLRLAIIRGDMAPGNRVVESRIAESFGISRTPVREALHKLEREALIKRLDRGGFEVLGVTRQDVEETFGIRSVLESYAARLAASKHWPEELSPLEDRIREYQKALEAGDSGKLLQLNTEFHDLLYALSRSPRLIRMINGLRDQIYRFRRIILAKEAMARASNDDHRRMLELIRDRSEDAVEALVREHILRGRDAVLRDFDENPAAPHEANGKDNGYEGT